MSVGLVHTPTNLILARGGKRRSRLGRAALYNKPIRKQMKISKEVAGYAHDMDGRNCGHCMYYKAGLCALVEGSIDPAMWCKFFGAGSPVLKDLSASSVHAGGPIHVLPVRRKKIKKQHTPRQLEEADADHYKVPFRVDPDALLTIARKHPSPDFLHALVNGVRTDSRKKVKLKSLIATHPVVEKQKIDQLEEDDHGTPAVVRFMGKNIIVDGTHHLTGEWAQGKKKAKVCFVDLTGGIDPESGEPYHDDVTKGLKERKRSKVSSVMHEWGQGKLHSGSKNGPVVTDQKQAIAIALSQARELNKRLEPLIKFNQNHDEKGRFSAGSSTGYEATRAGGEAIGSVTGTYAGRALGGTLGSFVGPEGTAPGAYVGGFVGGIAGDYIGRRIAQAVYQFKNPGAQLPAPTLARELGGGLAGLAGYAAGGPLGGAAARAIGTTVSRATAVGRVLGQAAGDVAGTRFGDYVANRVGGVLAETKGQLGARYGSDVATDAAVEAVTPLKKRGSVKVNNENLPIRSSYFPPMWLRNDLNDEKYMVESPRETAFRTMLNEVETKQRSNAARLVMYGRRLENLQPRTGESWQSYHQRLLQGIAEQKAAAFPWDLSARSG